MKSHLLMISLLAIAPAAAGAREPARPPPILRVETGHHTAAVRTISTDQDGKWLLTSSEDMTARLWDAPTGKLIRTLRVEIGGGTDGSINGAALSPSGKTIVLSAIASGSALFVIDRASGRLLRRVAGLPTTAFGLAFSRDGKRLAATCQLGGLVVFDTSTWKPVFKDPAYGGPAFSADFDATGRLVTACHDGIIRLYGADGSVIASANSNVGRFPHSVSFSPDGTYIAVGFIDLPKVALITAKDLSNGPLPDTTGLTTGDLHTVAWTGPNDLAAGGTASVIRVWQLSDLHKYQDFPRPSAGVILRMVALPGGNVAYGSADSSWGVLSPADDNRRWDGPVIADYDQLRLLLLDDGKTARFSYEPHRELAKFAAATLELTQKPSKEAAWILPRLTDPHLTVVGWHNEVRPTLNGHLLPVTNGEVFHSLAIAPDGGSFVLGSDWHLFSFRADGKMLWTGAAPGIVEALNLSPDGKLLVVAYSDGTIRWQRASDGAPLLMFLPITDRARWVAWTPSGYYATSAGAEDLVGFVLDQGPDRLPIFAPASKFRARFHRPDVLERILDTLDEKEAVRQADEARRPSKARRAAPVHP